MEHISIEGTAQTPSVTLNAETGVIEIKGRSIPENAWEFYKPIYDWLEAYAVSPHENTRVELQFDYLNTSSSKRLFDIFHKFEKLAQAGNNVVINWYYEKDDDDMLETGEDFQDILKIPFTFIEIEK